jgi:hypothetical protein
MKKLSFAGMITILCFGFILRTYKATSIALWHDEGLSVFLTRLPWKVLLHHIAQDVQAPFYYILLKLWQIPFGSSLFALRSMSILFGVAAILACYLFVQEAFKNKPSGALEFWRRSDFISSLDTCLHSTINACGNPKLPPLPNSLEHPSHNLSNVVCRI